MPLLTPEAERAIRAFAYYFSVDEKQTEYWIKQWKLSNLTKTKPNNKYPHDDERSDSTGDNRPEQI